MALLSSVVTWIAAGHIRSPQDEAARREPPTPSTITATVEQRVLSSRVVFRGDVVVDDPQSLVLSASGITTPVVTATLLKQGDEVVSGGVFIEIAGRPVLALAGAIPTFRDLGPATRGADVLQLETALEQLGFSPKTIDGVYDSDTSAAVTALYRSHGYSPPPPRAELVAAANEAELRQEAAADELAAAETALANATVPPTRAVVLAAESAVEVARLDLELARLSVSQFGEAAAAAVSAAEAKVEAAKTGSDDSALAAAQTELSNAIGARDIADLEGKSRLARAETALELTELQLAAPETALATVTVPPTRAAVLAAESAVEVARLDLELAKLSVSQFGEAAAAAVSAAEAKVEAAKTGSDDSALAAAQTELSNAIGARDIADLERESRLAGSETALELTELQLVEVKSKPNVKDQTARLDTARSDLSAATADLAAATNAIMTPLPANEFVFVQRLPQSVTSVFAELGQIAPETIMEVSDAGLAIVGVVSPAQHQLLTTGLSGTADEVGLDLAVTVVVVDVATQPTNGSFQVRLEVTEGSITAAEGLNLRVSIPILSTGDAVIAVPFAALTSGPQGEARLSILREDGVTDTIEVVLGLSADGFVEIVSSSGDLSVGDEVVIGSTANG